MSRNSGNASKTKKLMSGTGTNPRHKRKAFQKLSDSSSTPSNGNSTAHSEEDERMTSAYVRTQEVEKNASHEEQEQITKKLEAQVKELKHKLRILEESVDSKDYSLGTIAREKDRAVGEIRRLERSNKLLRQQLNDERSHYLEEKERFCDEMTKYKKKLQEVKSETDGKKAAPPAGRQPLINQSLRWQFSKEKGDFAEEKTFKTKTKNLLKGQEKKRRSSLLETFIKQNSLESLHLYQGDDVALQMAALRTENAKLRSIICERDEQNYELCLRFLRMKHYKNDIKDRFHDLESEYLQVIANLMEKIDEARQEFNFIIDQKFKRPLHSTNAMYLQMVQKNSRMAFENASLRLENQCLKKELNKYVNAEEYERKNDSVPGTENLAPGSGVAEGKREEEKSSKKNVNFNEVRTIYERYLTFKTSDTDSNYMSRTSTTGPSNGSLGEVKSNDSIAEDEKSARKTIQFPIEGNALPDDIIKKIFKRIDSSSSQTLTTERVKDSGPVQESTKGAEAAETPSKVDQQKVPQEEEGKKPLTMERKSPGKVTDSSSPSEGKGSLGFWAKGAPFGSGQAPQKESFLWGRRQGKPESTFRSRLRSRVRCQRDSEGSSSLDFPLRRITLSGRARPAKREKLPLQQEQEAPQQWKPRPKQFNDSCALQEKLEFSDLELPTSGSLLGAGSKASVEQGKPTRVKPEVLESEEEEEDLSMKIGARGGMKNLTPAIGSRSRSSNKISLQDELMEAHMRQKKQSDPFLKKEKRLSSVCSKALSLSYRSEERFTDRMSGVSVASKEEPGPSEQEESPHLRKPETNKRFSQRLFATSPEQLKSILTESQTGSFRVTPVLVSQALTGKSSSLRCGERSSEVFLQLVLPPQSPRQSALFSDNEMAERGMEKETFLCDSGSVRPRQSSNQTETCTSDIRIALSSLPTSNSTMEMIDSAAFERSNILMRTLSAPGLLESNWLDPHAVCEMRDCSTNT